MKTLYESAAAQFETALADLRPVDSYAAIGELAVQLAHNGFKDINAKLGTAVITDGKRSAALLTELQRAYALYSRDAGPQALEIAVGVVASADTLDPFSKIDGLHLIGRIRFDEDRFEQARECYVEEMELAQRADVVPGFVRAVHEISRVQEALSELLLAEFGFRLAWHFYAASMLRSDPEGTNNAPGSDVQNAMAAIRSLQALSESYTLFERGPTDADALIDRLRSPHLSSHDATGPAFLELRALATLCFASIPQHSRILARLTSRALSFHREHPRLCGLALEEAEYVANLCGESFSGTIRRSLEGSAVRPLATNVFYKPSAEIVFPVAADTPYGSPDAAARAASELYRYLAESDARGRYVYRGQTAHYPGPLMPSAFRQILTEERGRTTKTDGDQLYGGFSLRKCGKRFVGEYNACFQHYANPVRHLTARGVSPEKVEAAVRLYKRVLDDPAIGLEQEGEQYVPWVEAVRRVLSDEEFDLFSENQGEWMFRINNYHRRLYRMERFVRLFGYTLGTTFAQQYGFSSEGLDATKSLDVAFFFATRDSKDFETVKKDGVGVIYRFPFPRNDVATSPLEKYDYYTLPSIVDVKDVIYRFEVQSLAVSDSRMCLDAYVGASLIDGFQDQNLLLLPEGFYETTRVHQQDAVIILPDEIREDHADREPGVGGIRLPKYRYIEDLLARTGVQAFYFRHSGETQPGARAVTRTDLWPREDVLLEMAVRIVLATYRLRIAQPKRPDLIDVGYDNEAFAKECSERFWSDRPTFFSEYENVGRRFGALTM